MSNKQEVKTILVKEGIVWVSPLEPPPSKGLYDSADPEEIHRHEKALKLFSESMVRVENQDLIKTYFFDKGDVVWKDGTYPAPAGLQYERICNCGQPSCDNWNKCICSFVEEQPQKEEELIVELVENCKLVKVTERTEENGHDCWGKLEWTTHMEKRITIKGEEHWAINGWWIIHDGVSALKQEFTKPEVEYQEMATGFNYGWTRSTEKDYNNPKAGFEYRMILKPKFTEKVNDGWVSVRDQIEKKFDSVLYMWENIYEMNTTHMLKTLKKEVLELLPPKD